MASDSITIPVTLNTTELEARARVIGAAFTTLADTLAALDGAAPVDPAASIVETLRAYERRNGGVPIRFH